jgi:dipeptidyl aminopeptidase/acylaminoacyl peptidase
MIELFPGNYAWSQAALRAIFVGGSPGDVLRVVEVLSPGNDADPLRWYEAWSDVGDAMSARAADAQKRGRTLTAAASWLRAAIYAQWSVAFLPVSDPRREAGLRRAVDLYRDHARASDPAIERVEVPYEGSSFPAWLVTPITSGPFPAVIYLPGWDSTKEQGSGIAAAMKERGIATLLCDGPGIGEAVGRGMPNRHDYEVPGSAAFDWLAQTPGVDQDRIGVVGSSLGGYRAARFAAFEPRLAATVVWGAIWDFGAVWRRQLEQPGSSLPTNHDHALHVTASRSLDEVTAKLAAWTLTGVADRITSPLLILHGAADSQIPLEDAERLHAVAASRNKTLRVFERGASGSAHCQNDNRVLAHEEIGDWLAEVLAGG